MSPPPSPSPEATVDRAYELIGFAEGGTPDWTTFRTLFTEPCTLALRVFPGDPAITVMDMDAYVVAQMAHGLSEQGYSETPGDRTVNAIGEVAMVHQQFEMNFAAGPPVPATDIFSLAFVDGRWLIVSIVSDVQSAIPTTPSR
jgi:hypothetical protein